MRRRVHQTRAGAFDLGRLVASLLLVILTLLGSAAVALPFLFQSKSIRARVEREVAALVKDETGLDLSFRVSRTMWPPGVVLQEIEVASTVPNKPFARITEARVTLKPFALLSGRVVIDGVELSGASIEAEIVDDKPVNLPLKLKEHPPKPKSAPQVEPPFRSIAITNARIKASYKKGDDAPIAVDLSGIDFDVDVLGEGTIEYEVQLKKLLGVVRTNHKQINRVPYRDRFDHKKPTTPWLPYVVADDDVICKLELGLRITDAPTARRIDLRRLELEARLDDDPAGNTEPSCAPGAVPDDRVFALRLDHVEVTDLRKEGLVEPVLSFPPSGGKLRVRTPANLAARYVKIDPLGGWVAMDLDITARIDTHDPLAGLLRASVNGNLEGHELRFGNFRFGSGLAGDLSLKPGLVVGSKKLDVQYGDGLVTLSDVEVRLGAMPLAKKKMPLKANIAIKDVTIPGLVRELGVSKAAHVRWDFKDATIKLAGFLDPLQIDGDLVVKSRNFEMAPRPIEQPNPGHIIGLSPKTGGIADITGRVAIRPEYLAFEQIHAQFGGTKLDARVLLGFVGDRLEVDAKSDQIDLADASPLSKFPLAGVGKVDWKVRGTFADPQGSGTASFNGFVFDTFALGNIESVGVKFRGTVIELDALKAKHGDSAYEVTSMRLDLGRKEGPVLDALAKSNNMSLEDVYAIFRLNGDPRWEKIQGHVGFDARAHFVTGGKEDPCGSGKLELDLGAKVLALDLWGERYDGGAADLTLEWFDLDGGGLGMDLDLRAATLKKKGGGTIVTSGQITRGGKLNLKVTASGVTLKNLAAMPPTQTPIEGTIDAVADVSGTFETMTIAADAHVSPLHIGPYTLDKSHLRIARTPLELIAPSPAPDAKGCYPKADKPSAAFDATRWASDPLTGEFSISGDMFGGAVKLDDFRLTDQRKMTARGKVVVRDLSLAPLMLLQVQPPEAALDAKYQPPPPTQPITGTASFDVTLKSYPLDAWWNSEGSVEHLTLNVARGDLGVATVAPTPPILFGKDGASIGQTTLGLRVGEIATKVLLSASLVRDPHDSKSPDLKASIELPGLPLSRLEEFFPRIFDRAEGTAHAKLNVAGTLATPQWDGELKIENGAFAFKAASVPLVSVNAMIKVDPKKGVTIEKMHGELGGGTLDVTGGAKLKGFEIGDVDVKLAARGVHFRYGEAMSTTFDADLRTTWSPPEPGTKSSPMRIDGSVDIESFLYEKSIKFLDPNSIQTAKRTEVEAYDAALDTVAYEIEIKAKRGFRARNNFADATFAIGKEGLRAIGTNQRYGLIGDLYVTKGSVFHFRRHDFEITESTIKFDDETKIDPLIDITAVTEFRRATQTGSSGVGEWRIKLHAFGTISNLKLEFTSEPSLTQEDIVLLLTIGMTRAEANRIGGSVASGAGLDFLANVAGVDETLKQAIPVIDDIRFGTAYSLKTGRTEPQVTLGKKLTDTLRASVTSGFGERREVLANIEWRLSQNISLQGNYDNVNDVSSRTVGNVGVDLRYRIEF